MDNISGLTFAYATRHWNNCSVKECSICDILENKIGKELNELWDRCIVKDCIPYHPSDRCIVKNIPYPIGDPKIK